MTLGTCRLLCVCLHRVLLLHLLLFRRRRRRQIIDYSLLVGIHFRDPANPIQFPGEDDPTAVQLKDGGVLGIPECREVYYIGACGALHGLVVGTGGSCGVAVNNL
eukprot:SAG22_NODE_1765_length_3624_cov_2.026667_5_plen_105_part_00